MLTGILPNFWRVIAVIGIFTAGGVIFVQVWWSLIGRNWNRHRDWSNWSTVSKPHRHRYLNMHLARITPADHATTDQQGISYNSLVSREGYYFYTLGLQAMNASWLSTFRPRSSRSSPGYEWRSETPDDGQLHHSRNVGSKWNWLLMWK